MTWRLPFEWLSIYQFFIKFVVQLQYQKIKTMKDIINRKDIETLLTRFYQLALVDPHIGVFFTEVVQLNLDKHLEKIIDFWEMMLFEKKKYQGNFLEAHLNLNKQKKIKISHFERWLSLFFKALDDEGFSGAITDKAKKKARAIAGTLFEKLK